MGKNLDQNKVLWGWRMRPGLAQRTGFTDMPARIITFAAELQSANLPPEVSMLLPTGSGSRQIADALTRSPHLFDGAITGLLVTDPAINFERTIKSMKAANNRWVANLPTIGLHDVEFKSFLNEVALGVSKEIEILTKFKARGIKIMAMLTDLSQAEAMAILDPDAVIILPTISDFLDGWPSLATREENESALRAALNQNGWNGPCLGYRAKNEDSNGWPCLERPNLLTR